MYTRKDGRSQLELRKITLTRNYLPYAEGSCLVEIDQTRVITSASVENSVPNWLSGTGSGWVTAEYDMLPSSTGQRRRRSGRSGKIDGRSQEIQRLIGRTLRSVVDMSRLGENTLWLDCDVLQADGGTRTAAITGAYIALADALSWARRKKFLTQDPLTHAVAAVSVGIVAGKVLLDLDYAEDSSAQVDMNVAITSAGKFVEVQASAEDAAFTREQFDKMLRSASKGIRSLLASQQTALKKRRKR